MTPHRRAVLAAVLTAVVLAGGATALVVRQHRSAAPPTPLPPLARTQFVAPAAPVPLPFHVTGTSRCPAYSYDSPVAAPVYGRTASVGLGGPTGEAASVHVVCLPDAQVPFGSLDAYVDALRRKPAELGLVGEPVVEVGPLGAAVRTEERMAGGASLLTQWRVERAGTVVVVGYLRHTDDHSHDVEVQSMLASWTWG